MIKLCKKPAPFSTTEVSSEALFAVLGHEQTAERLLALDGATCGHAKKIGTPT